MYSKRAKCLDCGELFDKRSYTQVRCPNCQKEYRKLEANKRYWKAKGLRYIAKETKLQNGAVYHNGHPQVCKVMDTCYYGSKIKNGCSYLLETGVSRIHNGLWIEDGKCPAYTESKSKRRKRQTVPTYMRRSGSYDDTIHDFGEV